jgi:hypothetical protein
MEANTKGAPMEPQRRKVVQEKPLISYPGWVVRQYSDGMFDGSQIDGPGITIGCRSSDEVLDEIEHLVNAAKPTVAAVPSSSSAPDVDPELLAAAHLLDPATQTVVLRVLELIGKQGESIDLLLEATKSLDRLDDLRHAHLTMLEAQLKALMVVLDPGEGSLGVKGEQA